MKKLITVIMVVIVLCLMPGCKGKVPEKTGVPNIAFLLKTLSNEYWAGINDGILKIAKEKNFKATIFSVDNESDAQGQLKKFEDILLQNFDVICFSPITPTNLNSAIVEANKMKIPVVNIDDLFDMDDLKSLGGHIDVFVSADNIVMGRLGAEELVEEMGGAGGEVVIIEGIPGVTGSEDRKKGAKEVLARNPNIKIIAEMAGDWDKVKALDIATNLLQSNPQIKAFHCANDTMALGVVEAIKNSGKKGQVLVAGVDGDPSAIEAIAAGEMTATALQDTYQTALTTIDAALSLVVSGQKQSMETIFVDLVKVYKANAKDYL